MKLTWKLNGDIHIDVSPELLIYALWKHWIYTVLSTAKSLKDDTNFQQLGINHRPDLRSHISCCL